MAMIKIDDKFSFNTDEFHRRMGDYYTCDEDTNIQALIEAAKQVGIDSFDEELKNAMYAVDMDGIEGFMDASKKELIENINTGEWKIDTDDAYIVYTVDHKYTSSTDIEEKLNNLGDEVEAKILEIIKDPIQFNDLYDKFNLGVIDDALVEVGE